MFRQTKRLNKLNIVSPNFHTCVTIPVIIKIHVLIVSVSARTANVIVAVIVVVAGANGVIVADVVTVVVAAVTGIIEKGVKWTEK